MCAVGKAHRVYAMKYPCEVFSFSECKYYSLLERGQRSGLFPDQSSGLLYKASRAIFASSAKTFSCSTPVGEASPGERACLAAKETGLSHFLVLSIWSSSRSPESAVVLLTPHSADSGHYISTPLR